MKTHTFLLLKYINLHQRIIYFVIAFSLIIQSMYMYRITTQSLFLPDDAYYYFSLARNISEGNGPKVDTFNNTTGFQPLWGVICAFVFTSIHNNNIAILSLLLVSLLAELCTIWLLYKWMLGLAQPKTAIMLMTCWWILSSQTMLNMLNGMETSISILLVMAVYYSLKFKNDWATGLLCGLAILARIDALVLGIGITLVWFYQRRFRQIIILWLCIFLTALPWIIFILSMGKSLLPESGQAVWLITLFGQGLPFYPPSESIWRNPVFHWGQLVNFLDFWGWNTIALYPFSLFPNLSAILVCLFMILFIMQFRNIPNVAIFLLHSGGLIVAYSLFVGGNWFHFRYTASIGLLLSALIVGLFYQHIDKNQIKKVYAIFVSAGLIALHLLFNPILNSYYQGQSLTLAGGRSFYESAIWMNQNIPPSSIVGAFQSGVIGYYANFPILNLDGKVNNAAYAALRDKSMWQYICQSKVDYVVDWPSLVNKLLIKRSSEWKDDNLVLVKQISEVNIYMVNHTNCLTTDKSPN
ncbi:MAG: hypothetical protein KDJ52_30955 [Anaerolineae bacterium]|nr:hypothetical protein [Anaerolineae bacterium]